MRHVARLATGLLGLMFATAPSATGSSVQASVNASTRTLVSGPFVVTWHATNSEAITRLSWNGSISLVNSWLHPNCPSGLVSEFFGNAWGGAGDETFRSPVGWGSTGEWAQTSGSTIDVNSSASGCYGTSGIPVTTSYAFLGSDAATGRIQVERRFAFGSTPFASDLRPYIARLHPAIVYSQVLYPSLGGSLLTRNAFDCGLGCQQQDWAGTWLAIHDPVAGRGMIVRREASSAIARLWVDEDGGSATTASGIMLPYPGTGFTGLLVEREVLCFYDATTWTPGMTVPPNCAAAWTETAPLTSTRAGSATGTGTFSTATKTVAIGRYVTWRANLGAGAAGSSVEVRVSTRGADGVWSSFRTLTTRTADATGVVRFSWRQSVPRWVSVRFQTGATVSAAAQARWR